LEKRLKVILITSTNASEGKSTTASTLAITMAQADKRTLLMDCDLRKPSIHRPFGLLNEKGITNVLAEGLDFHTVYNSVGVQNLDVLTSGPKPPNPPELLGSSKMQALIKIVAEEYDVVIIDAPPVLPVTDAAVFVLVINMTFSCFSIPKNCIFVLKTLYASTTGLFVLGFVINIL
jgi:capsular exopolysaccharide synthesis family protein